MKDEIKLTIERELTPESMNSFPFGCPAIFETNKGSYAVIGKVLDAKELGINHRVFSDEVLIEIPKGIIDKKIK